MNHKEAENMKNIYLWMVQSGEYIINTYNILEDLLVHLETMDTGNIRTNIEKAMKLLEKI